MKSSFKNPRLLRFVFLLSLLPVALVSVQSDALGCEEPTRDVSVRSEAPTSKIANTRDRDPWSVTAVLNFVNNGVRVGRRLRGGDLEVSGSFGASLVDLNFSLCFSGNCGESKGPEYGPFFDVGARYLWGGPRLSGYMEARVNIIPAGDMFSEGPVSGVGGVGLRWQAYNGFTVVAGAQAHVVLREEPVYPWFNAEVGWSF